MSTSFFLNFDFKFSLNFDAASERRRLAIKPGRILGMADSLLAAKSAGRPSIDRQIGTFQRLGSTGCLKN
jgi:hypothetical protein